MQTGTSPSAGDLPIPVRIPKSKYMYPVTPLFHPSRRSLQRPLQRCKVIHLSGAVGACRTGPTALAINREAAHKGPGHSVTGTLYGQRE